MKGGCGGIGSVFWRDIRRDIRNFLKWIKK